MRLNVMLANGSAVRYLAAAMLNGIVVRPPPTLNYAWQLTYDNVHHAPQHVRESTTWSGHFVAAPVSFAMGMLMLLFADASPSESLDLRDTKRLSYQNLHLMFNAEWGHFHDEYGE